MIAGAPCLFIVTAPFYAAVSPCSRVRSICKPTLTVPLLPSTVLSPLTAGLDTFGVDSLVVSTSKSGGYGINSGKPAVNGITLCHS